MPFPHKQGAIFYYRAPPLATNAHKSAGLVYVSPADLPTLVQRTCIYKSGRLTYVSPPGLYSFERAVFSLDRSGRAQYAAEKVSLSAVICILNQLEGHYGKHTLPA
jgi:hypothetical protein